MSHCHYILWHWSNQLFSMTPDFQATLNNLSGNNFNSRIMPSRSVWQNNIMQFMDIFIIKFSFQFLLYLYFYFLLFGEKICEIHKYSEFSFPQSHTQLHYLNSLTWSIFTTSKPPSYNKSFWGSHMIFFSDNRLKVWGRVEHYETWYK